MNENQFIANDIAVLCIDEDILVGYKVDSYLPKLSRTLGTKGRYVCEARVIKNIPSVITDNVRELSNKYQLVVVIGGIGYMHDCHTSPAVAKALCLELTEDQEAKMTFLNVLQKEKIEYLDIFAKAFTVPRGSCVIPSVNGIAGYRVSNIIALPAGGAFSEACEVIASDLCSWYKTYMCRIAIESNFLKVADVLEQFAKRYSDVNVRVSLDGNEVILTATDFEILNKNVCMLKEMLLLEKLDFTR